ncbi:MAG: branched-chain amino acid ABC transporter permease [Chitinophagales bacterium]
MSELLAQLPQQLVNGLTLGSVYSLIALGYSMVYGTLEMLNFAHGDVFMVGAFAGWGVLALLTREGSLVVNPALTLLAMLLGAILLTAGLGFGIERLAYRPLRNAMRLAPLITALGVSIVLQNLAMLATAGRAKALPSDLLIPPGWALNLGPVTISFTRGLIVAVALFLMVVLDYLVRRTPLGQAMRATAEDQVAASYMGIRPDAVISLTFVLGSALAGAGGVLVAVYYTQVDFMMGFAAGLKAFTAAVLGGIGNLRGAMLGGLLLGMAEALGVAFVSPVYKDVLSFALLILILVVKPTGLLGEQVPDKV